MLRRVRLFFHLPRQPSKKAGSSTASGFLLCCNVFRNFLLDDVQLTEHLAETLHGEVHLFLGAFSAAYLANRNFAACPHRGQAGSFGRFAAVCRDAMGIDKQCARIPEGIMG